MKPDRRTTFIVAFAFLAAAAAAGILVLREPGERGIDEALNATARIAFACFLPAYVGGPLAALFGAFFVPLAQQGRAFGLAFASVEVVHLSLVAALCAIGDAPGRATFVLFGTAEGFVFLLALFSFGLARRRLHPGLWQAIRLVGMNFIAYAFFVDLSGAPFEGGFLRQLYYVPFFLCLLAGILCRAAALVLQIFRRWPGPRLLAK